MKNEKLKKELLKFKTQLMLAASMLPIGIVGLNVDNMYKHIVASEEIEMYDKTIDDLKDLFVKNGITEPDDIFKNFTYALWNGYLSQNQDFKYKLGKDNSISDKHLGTACFSGKAVCRHMATMLNNLFEAYGYESCTLVCFLDDGKSENLRNEGNHLITSVLVDDKIYYYDPTNRANLFKIDDDELAEAGNESITVGIRYLSSLRTYGSNLIDLNSIKNSEPNQYYVEQVEINRDVSLKDLVKFYEKHEELYKKVYEKTKHIYSDKQVRDVSIPIALVCSLTPGAICCISIFNILEKEKEMEKQKQLLKK